MKTLGIDVDEVLADYLNPFLRWHNHYYNTRLTLQDVTAWELATVLGISHDEERRRLVRFETPLNMIRLPPVPGSLEAIAELRKDYTLIGATARANTQRDTTTTWAWHMYGGAFKDVLFTDHELTTPPRYTKAELLRSTGASLIVDDSRDQCIACAKIGMPALLFGEFPYNEGPVPDGVIRVKNWPAAMEQIRRLA